MLETAKERIKLLKMGLSGKEIEGLYIEQNNFKLIHTPILYGAKEFDSARSNLDNNIPAYYKRNLPKFQFLDIFEDGQIGHSI
jgi:hypothetical protein